MARKNVFSASFAPDIKKSGSDESSNEGIVENVGVRKPDIPKASPQSSVREAASQLSARDEVKSLDPFSIRMSALQDRMDLERDAEQTIDDLAQSIKEHGQHVPILVRPHDGGPDKGGSYEIVYGRRRLLACQKIKVPVLARVRSLGDEEALIAQGQENSARLNTSFIEQALFVRSIKESHFKSEVITKATGLDKTAISRMNVIVSNLTRPDLDDVDIIRSIGPAHNSGRRPWEQLANLIKEASSSRIRKAVGSLAGETSDERLQEAITLMSTSGPAEKPEERDLGTGSYYVKTSQRQATLTIKKNPEFAEFLVSRIEDLYREWEGKQ